MIHQQLRASGRAIDHSRRLQRGRQRYYLDVIDFVATCWCTCITCGSKFRFAKSMVLAFLDSTAPQVQAGS